LNRNPNRNPNRKFTLAGNLPGQVKIEINNCCKKNNLQKSVLKNNRVKKRRKMPSKIWDTFTFV